MKHNWTHCSTGEKQTMSLSSASSLGARSRRGEGKEIRT